MHEPFDSLVHLDRQPPQRTLRAFGVAAASMFALLAYGVDPSSASSVSGRAVAGAARWFAGGSASLCAASALLQPRWNRPLYVLLGYVSYPLRWLLAWTSLVLLYFAILTPIAFGARRLRKAPAAAAGSAWLHARKRPDKARYFRQS